VGAPFINKGRYAALASVPREYSALTLDLIRSSTVIDMLGLLTLDYRKLMGWQRGGDKFRPEDFARLKESGTTIFHPGVGFTSGDVYSSSLRDLANWNTFIGTYSSQFIRIDSLADIETAKTQGKLGIILGLQNSQHFRTVGDVDFFYALGQRVSQLTYFDNQLGGGSTDASCGLTPFGASVVARMNQLGMAIDVSHCADRTTIDAIELSESPVLVTHSNCRALVRNCARCKTDDAIRKLAAKGGVMGVTMVRPFVRASGPATIENVLDHIDHVVSIAGVEHVGVGTDVDLDGRESRTPSTGTRTSDLDGMVYTRKIHDLTEGLLRRKYSRDNIQLILGGNFRRALAAIWNNKPPAQIGDIILRA
jgi:membrane dipeptidase